MGVHKAQTTQTGFASSVATQSGQRDLASVPHKDILNSAAPVKKEPYLARNFSRYLTNGPGQFGAHDLIGIDPPLVKLFQPLFVTGFETEKIALNFVHCVELPVLVLDILQQARGLWMSLVKPLQVKF